MVQRVMFLFALLFCASCQTPDNAQEVKSPARETTSKEITDVVEYHPSGAVKVRGKSQGGKRLGKWVSFYPTGYKWSEVIYRNGYREGDAITYYPNGMMRYQGRYYNDERTGIWTFYDTTGTLLERIDMDEPLKDLNYKTDSTGLN